MKDTERKWTMASSKEFLDFVMEQFMYIDDVTYKKMFGEYLFYRNGIIFGGIYDDRFLIKITKAGTRLMPDCEKGIPYEGAKEMYSVDNVDNREFLAELVTETCKELNSRPPKKIKK